LKNKTWCYSIKVLLIKEQLISHLLKKYNLFIDISAKHIGNEHVTR